MFDYTNILNNVSIPQIDNFGTDIVLRTVTETTSSDEWDPTFDTSDTTVRAVRTNYEQSEIDGTVIKHDDVLYLIAPDPAYPKPEMVSQLVDGAETYRVINIRTVKTGPLAVLWKVQCRK